MYHKRIVLDFDGTIVRIFHNYPTQKVVEKLHNLYKEYGVHYSLDADMFDAFYLYEEVETDYQGEIKKKVNEIITRAEVDSIDDGIIINGFFDFLKKCKEDKVDLAIVSNNSLEVINEFFKKNNIVIDFPVIGRDYKNPKLMKPNTFPLEELCRQTNLNKGGIVFIGDNSRDAECAKKFGCDFIAMTPTQKKKDRITNYDSTITCVNDFYDLEKLLEL